MTRTCLDCPAPITRRSQGRCSPCANKLKRRAQIDKAEAERRGGELNGPTRMLAERLLIDHTQEQVHAMLAKMMLSSPDIDRIRYWRSDMVRRKLVPSLDPYFDSRTEVREIDGCAALSAAMDALVERTAKRRRCSVDAAWLVLHRSPAQIAKMVARGGV